MKRRSRKELDYKNAKLFSRFTAFACVTVISSGLMLGGCGGPGGEKPEEGAEAEKDTSILVETASPPDGKYFSGRRFYRYGGV